MESCCKRTDALSPISYGYFQGTMTELEKPYLRLTTAPDPSQIRPEPILKKALKHFKKKWRDGKIEYLSISEQFRSMRQVKDA